jgi:hypothetical protein
MRSAAARQLADYQSEGLGLIAEIREHARHMRKIAGVIGADPGNKAVVTELLYATRRITDLEAALNKNTTALRRAARRVAFWETIELEEASAAGQIPGKDSRHLRAVPRAG